MRHLSSQRRGLLSEHQSRVVSENFFLTLDMIWFNWILLWLNHHLELLHTTKSWLRNVWSISSSISTRQSGAVVRGWCHEMHFSNFSKFELRCSLFNVLTGTTTSLTPSQSLSKCFHSIHSQEGGEEEGRVCRESFRRRRSLKLTKGETNSRSLIEDENSWRAESGFCSRVETLFKISRAEVNKKTVRHCSRWGLFTLFTGVLSTLSAKDVCHNPSRLSGC